MAFNPLKILISTLLCIGLFSTPPHSNATSLEGPLALRNQFPVSLRHLSFVPDAPESLEFGVMKVSLQMAVSNTFIHTRAKYGTIAEDQLDRGLTREDYLHKNGHPISGSNLYLDVESYRSTFLFKVGLGNRMELGLEWSGNYYSSGFMDQSIEAVHGAVGVDNNERHGAYRSRFEKNRYAFYMIRNDEFIFRETNSSYSSGFSDPVLSYKWNLMEQSRYWPSFTVKLAYKHPVSVTNASHHIMRTGRTDYGAYLILSKTLWEDWLWFVEGGTTFLGVPKGQFRDIQEHRLIGFETRIQDQQTWVMQWIRQTSIFPPKFDAAPGAPFPEVQVDRRISTSTDLLAFGMRHHHDSGSYTLGAMQDLNQDHNDTDFVLFLEATFYHAQKEH